MTHLQLVTDELPETAYFNALAQVPLPPMLPLVERVRRQEPFRRCFGDRVFVPRIRSLSADWFFRIACAFWARREAKTGNDLVALMHFVNERHMGGQVSEVDLFALCTYVASTYSRAPKRKTKKGWSRYELVPFDRSDVAEYVSDLSM